MKRSSAFAFLLLIFIQIFKVTYAESPADIIAINQAVYDIYVQLDDQKLREIIAPLGISKGGYKRIETQELRLILQNLPDISKKHAGGASANTLAGVSSLGGKTTFIGIIADDDFGHSFVKDMHEAKVKSNCLVRNAAADKGTALVILLITPDGERTILSYLGVSVPITHKDVDQNLLNNHKILFSDAYVWDQGVTSNMLQKAYARARKNKMITAFGLANASVVKMHRDQLVDFLKEVDIVFGNLSEYQALYNQESMETIIQTLQQSGIIAILTNAEHGALIITPEVVLHSPPKNVKQSNLNIFFR